jgi:outer membrane protein assembly factor BamD
VEEAEFLQGVAYFEQVGRIQRDISGAYEGRDQFQRFLKLYPQSRHAEEARGYLRRIADLVVRKRLAQAEVYRHLGQHEAAVLLLGTTLEEEHDSQLLDRVLLRRAEEAQRAGEQDVAEESYRRLLEVYPQSKLAGEAREALERLRAPDSS